MRNSLAARLRRLGHAALIWTAIAATAHAVENGQPDQGHRNVGVLGFDVDGPTGPTPPFGICSGFVLSDRAFVTAAHCLDPVKNIAQSWAVALDAGTPDAPISPPGVLSLIQFNVTDFPILVETVSTTLVHTHPRYNPATSENDIAVLEFPAGTFTVEPVKLAGARLLDRLERLRILSRVAVGIVGYGAEQALGNAEFAIPGFRKRGVSSISELSRTRFVIQPMPVRDAMVLPGDSGSPQFVLDRVVGITSVSDTQRLDITRARRFLQPFSLD